MLSQDGCPGLATIATTWVSVLYRGAGHVPTEMVACPAKAGRSMPRNRVLAKSTGLSCSAVALAMYGLRSANVFARARRPTPSDLE